MMPFDACSDRAAADFSLPVEEEVSCDVRCSAGVEPATEEACVTEGGWFIVAYDMPSSVLAP